MGGCRLSKSGGLLLIAVLTALISGPALEAQESRGYMGISLQCNNCWRKQMGDVVEWSFSSPPTISYVYESGPGASVGLEVGDLITAVDGVDITSDEGGRRFGSLQVGVETSLRIRRGDEERNVTITPTSQEAAFGQLSTVIVPSEVWDSMRSRMQNLFQKQLKLQLSLREAEHTLQRTETEAQRSATDERLQAVVQQRTQIDSMRRALQDAQIKLRGHADSLAARTLYVVPRAEPQAEAYVTPLRVEPRTLTIYHDAVAGARFKELSKGNPLIAYFPGVEEGLLVTEIVESTPAHIAGLREGDVVLAVNGEPVSKVSELRRRMRAVSEAELTYVRKGKKQKCKIPSR